MSGAGIGAVVLSVATLLMAPTAAQAESARGSTVKGPERVGRSWRFDGAATKKLVVAVPRGALRFSGSDTDAVTIGLVSVDGPQDCGASFKVEGSELQVTATREGGGSTARCVLNLDFAVPAAVAISVALDTGDVLLRDVASELTVRARTSDIHGTAFGDRVDVSTTTGKIRLSGLRSEVAAGTHRGGVSLRFDEVPEGGIVAHAGTGNVRIVLPDEPRGEIEATASSGRVKQKVRPRRSNAS